MKVKDEYYKKLKDEVLIKKLKKYESGEIGNEK